MTKIYKTVFWVLAASICIVILSIRPLAAEFNTEAKSGTGTGYTVIGNGSGGSGEIVSRTINAAETKSESNKSLGNTDNADPVKAKEASAETQSGNNIVSGSGDDTVYSFEGKQYTKESLYGSRTLTGYAAEESGTDMTYSGKRAKAHHTVATPSDIPLGTVIIIEGISGPNASMYNGVYVVEDRGGAALESKGLIDIFCASYDEAYAVTASGWNVTTVIFCHSKQERLLRQIMYHS